jgi:uncharacterized C2H2 Zn-finger protein
MGSGITVNGVPIDKVIAEELGEEITDHLAADIKLQKKIIARPGISASYQRPSGRTNAGAVIYVSGQVAQKIIVSGFVFPWRNKMPYVPSGHSTHGAIECSEDEALIRCNECGEWFGNLGRHVYAKHLLKAAAYKAKHGLRSKSHLVAPALLADLRIKLQGNLSRSNVWVPGTKARMAELSKLRRERVTNQQPTELLNLRDRCFAQTKARIQQIAQETGRTPTVFEAGLKNCCRRLYGITYAALIKSMGLPLAKGGPPKIDESKKSEVLMLRAEGKSYRNIAIAVGVSYGAVGNIVACRSRIATE